MIRPWKWMWLSGMIPAWFVLLSLFVPACALIMTGSTQVVTISSAPEATIHLLDTVYVVRNGVAQIDTTSWERKGSMSLRLRRGQPHRFQIECAGYKTARITTGQKDNAWVWGDLLVPLFLGVSADYQSGAAYDIVPDSIPVTLEKGEGCVPEVIYPTAPSNKPVIITLEFIIMIFAFVYAFTVTFASALSPFPLGY